MDYCVMVGEPALFSSVFGKIKLLDPQAEQIQAGEMYQSPVPTLLVIDTSARLQDLEKVEGVVSVVSCRDACSCGSGEAKDALYDARGIFCCYYCSACEAEKRGRYRADVLEDSSYQVDEPIYSEED